MHRVLHGFDLALLLSSQPINGGAPPVFATCLLPLLKLESLLKEDVGAPLPLLDTFPLRLAPRLLLLDLANRSFRPSTFLP